MVCWGEKSGKEDLNNRRGANALFRCCQCRRGNILECNARKSTIAWDTEVSGIQGFVNFPGTTVMARNSIPNPAAGKSGVEMLKVRQGEAKVKNEYDDR
jgi:hypothetical protein